VPLSKKIVRIARFARCAKLPMLPLMLASASPYRRELLARLGLPFTVAASQVDETLRAGESAQDLVRRLAEEKARALAASYPQHLIVGSDQVAVLGDAILGKPHNMENAVRQLKAASGKHVDFLTGLALLNSKTGRVQVDCVRFAVHFRDLDEATICRYLQKEQPFDCAGSFKSEGLGISLFRRTEGEDASALIGLPLIRLTDMLLAEGVNIP